MRWRFARVVLTSCGLAGVTLMAASTSGATSVEAARGSMSSAEARTFPCVSGRTVWARAKTRAASASCSLLLRATVLLESEPDRAEALAREALAVTSSGALADEARFVLGTAQFLRGRFAAAHEEFTRVGVVRWPERYRLAAARTEVALGSYTPALAHYRALFSSPGRLGPRERSRALLEASSVTLHAKPDGFSEARAYLSEAARLDDPFLSDLVRLARALVALREENRALALEIARGLADPGGVVFFLQQKPSGFPGRGLVPFWPVGESSAFLACLEDLRGDAAARASWQTYLEEGSAVPAHLRRVAERRIVELGAGR